MNYRTDNVKGAMLAIAVLALAGRVAWADEPFGSDIAAQDSVAVVAVDEAPLAKSDLIDSADNAADEAVAEALSNMNAANKLQLELRLTSHKSVFIAANR